MVRPRRCRRVGNVPGISYFKPAGVGVRELEEIVLTVDEYEAVRLKDLEALEQEEAAKKMGISQPTLHRLLLSARKKIAEAIVKGKAIKIEGGSYTIAERGIGRRMGAGSRRGAGKGPLAAGPGGMCVCPKCGHKVRHEIGISCSSIKCLKCGTKLTRE